MVFYTYSTTDTFHSQPEFAIDLDIITLRPEVRYCLGFPSETLPWITIYGESCLLMLLPGRMCEIGPFPYIFPTKTFQSLFRYMYSQA